MKKVALYMPTVRYGKPNPWNLKRIVGDSPDYLDYQRRQGSHPSFYYPKGNPSQPLYSFSQIKSTVEPIIDPDASLKLQRWEERVGKEEANRICEETKAAGEMAHKALESWSQNKPLGPCSMAMMGYRQALENDILPHLERGETGLFVTDDDGEVHPLSEVFVADFGRNFIGRLDLVTRINNIPSCDNLRVLLELKGSRSPKKLEYMEPHFIQAVAYQQTFNKVAEAYPSYLEPLDGVAIAYIHPNGTGSLIPIFGEELEEYEQLWEERLACFHSLLGGLKVA